MIEAPEETIPTFVEEVEHHAGETTAIGYGYRADEGKPVRFAGDARTMYAIIEAIEAEGEPVLAYVSEWQLI